MTDLEARIAEVLTAHSYAGMDGQYADRCKCGWAGNGDAETAKHQAAMLAPVIREAQAEAWADGVATALNHAILNKDGITLRLEHLDGRPWANPYEEQS